MADRPLRPRPNKKEIFDYVIILVFFILALLFLSLAVSAVIMMYKQQQDIGDYILSSKDDTHPVQNYNISIQEIYNFTIDYGESNFTVPPIEVIPYHLNLSIDAFRPSCNACDVHRAAFLYRGMCYYFTSTEHTFSQCFNVCASYADCYFFYSPVESDWALIKGNLKQNQELWVGSYKLGGEWHRLDSNSTDIVWDLYGSYCAFMSKTARTVESYFDCDFLRQCLCAGTMSKITYLSD